MIKMSASPALVIHSFCPLRIYLPSFLTAFVLSAKASEPDELSDKQYEPTLPVASWGRYFFLSASEPQRMNALLTRVFCTSTITPTDGSTCEIACTARIAVKKEASEPSRLCGTSMPMR